MSTDASHTPPPPTPPLAAVDGLLAGRVAIVTGAGQGVGEGIAASMAAAGATVLLAARRAETGEPATRCAYAEPDFTCDVSSTEEEVGSGLDATLLVDNVFSGEVPAVDEIAGRISLEVECDGGSCFLLELAGLSFPCTLEGTFDLDH